MSDLQEIPFLAMATVTREQLRLYAEASGDHNSIHLDDKAARAVGLDGVIAHGMLTAALISEQALRFAGKGWYVSKMNIRFKAMTFPEDTVFVGGTVKATDSGEMEFELQAKNQKGEVTTTGGVLLRKNRVDS